MKDNLFLQALEQARWEKLFAEISDVMNSEATLNRGSEYNISCHKLKSLQQIQDEELAIVKYAKENIDSEITKKMVKLAMDKQIGNPDYAFNVYIQPQTRVDYVEVNMTVTPSGAIFAEKIPINWLERAYTITKINKYRK